MAFAPSSLILANNFLPLNEALGVSRGKMKILVLVSLLFCANAHSIVPNTKYYESAKNRINLLKVQVKEIESSLIANKGNDIELQLKLNIEKEIELLKQRIQLYEKLENSNLIMY